MADVLTETLPGAADAAIALLHPENLALIKSKTLRNSVTASLLESRLLEEIAEIERKQRELSEEKFTLERMLLKARQQNELAKRTDVTRKNSLNRLLIEGSILQSLGAKRKPVSTHDLYNDARLVIGTLRPNTFRSILHRMKARQLVSNTGRGRWVSGIK
jgi:hypothetical protein